MTKHSYEDILESPKEGLYIHGLYLQAGSWDRRNGRVIESRPKQLFDSMPVIHVTTTYDLTPEEIRIQQQKIIDESAGILAQKNTNAAEILNKVGIIS